MSKREDFPHLNDSQWGTLHRMAGLFGDAAVGSLLTEDPAVHIARINAFREHERSCVDTATAQATEAVTQSLRALHMQERDQLTAQHNAALAAAKTDSRVRDHARPIKLDVSLFEGRDGENIMRWFLEVEVAMRAARIVEEDMKVAFGMSFLKKKSVCHEWAYTVLLHDLNVFPTWEIFKEKLYLHHQGKHMAHNHRARFLACKQGKSSVYAYVQELRQLAASIASEDMTEAVKVTTILEGLNVGPARTQLFRADPKSFEEACRIAIEEDNSQKRAGFRKPAGQGDSGPTPMDVGSIEPAKAKVRCFNCNETGHYSRECRKPRRNGGGQRSTRGTNPFHTARQGGRGGRGRGYSPPGNGLARS